MGEPQSNCPLKLYSYWRSSCSCRVRIALNLKGLDYEYIPINVVKGEQFSPEFRKLNPIGYVPALVDGDVVISDSFAILLYLDEKYPQRPLLPTDIRKKAINYQAANIVSSSIQPLQNITILKYIEEKVSPDEKLPWVQCHIGKGFELWNRHDAIVHGHVQMADRFLLDKVACLHVEFLDANPPSPMEHVEWKDCKWVEPVNGRYKINADGALKEEDGVKGVGVVIRNADGK
ncbi:hypothetical protein FEM48_Zijuj08G0192300 [Ziziphus jujuba var. spinosa]|uniref:glutathione transferase n=1 Tax=Ziziphus jujuba var. spinosa TaxID=714518 RepID=A0A978V0W1_ZIZJJ|nr:hypothetical protein FEM48_Zijuj08G0192300 [Ziziphus jujuba var. spinosa]